jgi:CheY-like chemotaxis protein
VGQLTGGVAHDFNNLLTTVLGNAELAMMDHPHSGPLRDSLEEIRKAAMRASNLSGQMLAYSGQGRLQASPVHLGAMIDQMTPLLTATVSRQIRLDIHTEEDLPTVTGDPTQLKQVVINLVTNAAEAIGAVRGTISLSLTTVDVGRDQITNPALNDCLRAGRHVCLEVADTGSGMDPETQRRLFDPFFTTKFTGRGLGLAAVLGIVRSHQGGIQVRSEWGTGSSFRVLLPVAEDRGDARSVHRAADSADAPTVGTVLIVDDEESVRRTARRMLQHHGLNVIEAADGQEALQVVRHQGQDLDMVLLDLTMPGLSGERTCRRIGQLLPELPIVMTSGYEADHAEQAFAETGARGFLKKPFDMARLIHTVQDMVKDSR